MNIMVLVWLVYVMIVASFVISYYIAAQKGVHLVVTVKAAGSNTFFSFRADQYFVWYHVQQVR